MPTSISFPLTWHGVEVPAYAVSAEVLDHGDAPPEGVPVHLLADQAERLAGAAHVHAWREREKQEFIHWKRGRIGALSINLALYREKKRQSGHTVNESLDPGRHWETC